MENQDYFDFTDGLFSVSDIFDKPEAMKGVRVVELCTRVFGPVTADLLGDFGAEVIKIELPGVGDLMRYVAPRGFFWQNMSPAFVHMNHNKYHIGIDIRKPEGGELLRRLVRMSDILVENFRPGTMDKWGVGYRELKEVNPGLIYQANSGFGQWSSQRDRPSYDATSQAMSGFSAITGFLGRAPLKTGVWIGDCTGAMFSVLGILTALYYRRKTGKGQIIDVSQGESLVRCLDWTWLYLTRYGKDRAPNGNRDMAISPSAVLRCKDGFIGVAAVNDRQFQGLCTAMNRPEMAKDERFATFSSRVGEENAEALHRILSDWAASMTMEDIEKLAEIHGFAAHRVTNARDHYHDEHLKRRGAVCDFEDPLYGNVVEYGPGPKLSASPGRMRSIAKPVGFHNDYVFRDLLGLSTEEIEELEEKKVIGRWDDRVGAKPPDDWKSSC
ncbi:putative acyl-CoA transferases/carnitine dehydratase [Syntrophobacter sp. SbD1]|nr:putative acyl-CoA transferases/carnitine dehydratase [Syntrophobacter sp. SbD1]